MSITYDKLSGKFIATVDGRIVRKSKHKSYCEKALEEMSLFRSSEDELREKSPFSVTDRFKFISQFIQMIGKKDINSMVITGDPGIGKSYSVVHNLTDLGLEEIVLDNDGNFIVIKGFSTARALYETLWTYNDKIVIFDDADNIHKDPVASNLLKAALDSGPNRIMSWGAKIPDSEDLPSRFKFTGRCIFISNMSINQFPQALLSRSFCVDLTLTIDEKLERINTVLVNYNGKTDEVMSFLRSNSTKLKDVSIRSALAVLKLANSLKDWEKLALYTLTV
jgi:hypothetical protein